MQEPSYRFQCNCGCDDPRAAVYETDWNMYDVVNQGTPICRGCGKDMELVGQIVTQELKNLCISIDTVLNLVEYQSIVGDINSNDAEHDRQAINVVKDFMESIK